MVKSFIYAHHRTLKKFVCFFFRKYTSIKYARQEKQICWSRREISRWGREWYHWGASHWEERTCCFPRFAKEVSCFVFLKCVNDVIILYTNEKKNALWTDCVHAFFNHLNQTWRVGSVASGSLAILIMSQNTLSSALVFRICCQRKNDVYHLSGVHQHLIFVEILFHSFEGLTKIVLKKCIFPKTCRRL